jgi:hypothetical protein
MHADPGSFQQAARACAARYLDRVGSIVFRGFPVPDVASFHAWAASFGEPLLAHWEPTFFEPPLCGARSAMRGRESSAAPVHAEYAHASCWPSTLWFWSAADRSQCATLQLADAREVYRRVPDSVRARLCERGIRYVHHFGPQRAAWPVALRSLARDHIEAWCRDQHWQLAWAPDGGLSIQLPGAPAATHPRTGEPVWFSQVHALATGGVESGRCSVRHADGSAIEPALVAAIARAYEEATTTLRLEPGDVLLLDNMLVAHGHDADSGLHSRMSAPRDLSA